MTATPTYTELVAKQFVDKGICLSATPSRTGRTIITEQGEVFVKIGTAGGSLQSLEALKYEAEGLKALSAAVQETAATLAVPKVWSVGSVDEKYFLAMDYLHFGSGLPGTIAKFGHGLGKVHSHQTGNATYGFHMDGCLGSSPQLNNCQGRQLNWVEFWREYRLGHQLEMAKEHFPTDTELHHLGAQLLSKVPDLFSMLVVEDIQPSLLHGDLWSGNWSILEDGHPCIYDPACYYGHSEADHGIMHMFGGFPKLFWDAYHHQMPKQPGYEERSLLYELHHHLNHMNIFGTGYRFGVVELIRKLL